MSYRRSRFLAIAAVVAFLLVPAVGRAMPESAYFLQDDVVVEFGISGDPFSVDTTVTADGRMLFWDVNAIAGWFFFSGTSTASATSVGDKWQMDYHAGADFFEINTEKDGSGTVLWIGNVDYFQVLANKNEDPFSAAPYDRPAYETEPSEFAAVGTARFTRTGGVWIDPVLVLEWVGIYNVSLEGTEKAHTNMQAKLIIPEPGGILAFAIGTLGLATYVGRRKARRLTGK